MSGAKVVVEVEGRQLGLSNLDKVLYPEVGFTKGQVIDYWTRIAPVMLPHLRDRAATRVRCPDGVEGERFFEKNRPRGTPEWVRTEEINGVDYVVVDDLPTLVWTANLAALELHTHQWRIGAKAPDQLVVDLDPGPPASVVECCRVALMAREHLVSLGLEPVVKTSGSKGLQVYAAAPAVDTNAFAKVLAEGLEQAHPDLVVSRMTKALRPGKVLVDWSQNNPSKTTVTPYSLRARPRPTVSTPITWEEVEGCRVPEDLVFTTDDVLDRVSRHGDLFAGLLSPGRG
ncbi:MAG TPA: non-homologous end-joining DNA ligase [Mycobacteriales bacterium]|nr:non-homologous end-joining DNA ligase [Mycobacteriales bacterium]